MKRWNRSFWCLIYIPLSVLVIPESVAQKTIDSIAELQLIGNDGGYPLDGSYILSQDIDASDTVNWNSGDGFEPIAPDTDSVTSGYQGTRFSGTFDGNGHSVTGLYISRIGESFVGLFGATDDDAVIENVQLAGGSVLGNSDVGALIGDCRGTVSKCASSTDVSADMHRAGGLIGNLTQGYVTSCSTSGDVVVINFFGVSAGGLIGEVDLALTGEIRLCSSSSYVEGQAGYTGGLIGHNSAPVYDSFATGTVDGRNSRVGGLIGNNSGDLSGCFATGSVTAANQYLGGLIGYNSGVLDNCYATGNVDGGETASAVGGLMGRTGDESITRCYAAGHVVGENIVGGFVGFSQRVGSVIQNCFATGSVTGVDEVGGFIGRNMDFASIVNSYSVGGVVGSTLTGGFVGNDSNGGAVTSSYWNTSTSGQATSADGSGLTTSQFHMSSSFSGWDFNDTWVIDEGSSYPYFGLFVAWVDFAAAGGGDGTILLPFDTLSNGVNTVVSGGLVKLTAGSSSETMTIDKAMTLESVEGIVDVGVGGTPDVAEQELSSGFQKRE